jgi:hypothetical protein
VSDDRVVQAAKAIYVANRHPRLTREAFAARWQEHNRLGASRSDPLMRECVGGRYCLTDPPPDGLPRASDEHDGVALLPLRGVQSIPAFNQVMTGNAVTYADELRTFERPVEQTTAFFASEVLVTGAETDVAVLLLLRRARSSTPSRFLASWRDHLVTSAGAGAMQGLLRRCVHNVSAAPAPRGFAYDAVTEMWFENVDDVAEAASDVTALFDAAGDSLDTPGCLTLVTRVILRAGRDGS